MAAVRLDAFHTVPLKDEPDTFAPDGSAIRLLARTTRVSMAHGELPAGATSLAIAHRTVDEVWFVLAGEADHWRALDGVEQVVVARAGMSLSIPVGATFQFRTRGEAPFQFIMCTVPAWPGADEAVRMPDHWPVDRVGA